MRVTVSPREALLGEAVTLPFDVRPVLTAPAVPAEEEALLLTTLLRRSAGSVLPLSPGSGVGSLMTPSRRASS